MQQLNTHALPVRKIITRKPEMTFSACYRFWQDQYKGLQIPPARLVTGQSTHPESSNTSCTSANLSII